MDTKTPPKAKSGSVKRFLPIGIIVIALIAFFALGGPKYVNLDTLKDNREVLMAFVDDNRVLTLLGFIMIYALLVGISFPGAGFLTIFGGFLFGTVTGGIATVMGATIGATVIFLLARYTIGDSLAKKAGPYMKKFEQGLQENELSYLFILRLVPLFPFFIVNIVPALLRVKLRNYVLATFFGIMPGTFVYASVGNGAGVVFDAGEELKLTGLMTQPHILIPIIGLIVLALIPVIYKKIKQGSAPAA
ncbi:MAG: TVP38/TMEM64 family protein [Hyphomonadaceae bacterium]|nr:TVP38/TMEM64 family protein [Hyphomonadaceae bacterium]MBC6411771.1 TVP38/TMEM64 family protein [Hyphomonadaceae bacterium]